MPVGRIHPASPLSGFREGRQIWHFRGVVKHKAYVNTAQGFPTWPAVKYSGGLLP